MILSSKEQFIPKYLDGSKKHSIRQGKRWAKGFTIQHYAKVRTKDMYKFMPDKVCTGVQDIFISFDGYAFQITIGETNYLYHKEKLELAINDGFDSIEAFRDFFFPNGKKGHMEGQIVHWTDLRY